MTGVHESGFIVSGGRVGRDRPGLLWRVVAPTTDALLHRFEPLGAKREPGCGGWQIGPAWT